MQHPKIATGRSRCNGEEDELLVVVPQLLNHQELFHTTPASFKLVPRISPCSQMAGFRSLIRSFRRDSDTFRLLFHAGTAAPLVPAPPPLLSFFAPSPSCPAAALLPDPSVALLHFVASRSRLFSSPLCRRVPFSGPLFLSSPPWKLLQSATPLYLQGEEVRPRLPQNLAPAGVGLGLKGRAGFQDAIQWVGPTGGLSDTTSAAGVGSEEKILNLPNLISISRMLSGPLIGWMIVSEWYLPAFIGLGISGITDWLDGYIARKLKINSVLGSYLDPLADKVLIGCVAVAMVKKDLLHAGLVELIVLRDVALISGAVFKRASSLGWEWKSWSDFINLDKTQPEKVEPLFISKVNTVFQLILVAAALLQPEFGTEQTHLYITYLRCKA
ncbi:hypothetical protein Taro_028181 [Colocasia esculenta]|uniref:Uncharacterized protein n=1 Tax=Colocasia esculenta TaxID=4460 RepID=A0A843VHS9_COLES|nr:hypothetical protein [Colocasia esculenta]